MWCRTTGATWRSCVPGARDRGARAGPGSRADVCRASPPDADGAVGGASRGADAAHGGGAWGRGVLDPLRPGDCRGAGRARGGGARPGGGPAARPGSRAGPGGPARACARAGVPFGCEHRRRGRSGRGQLLAGRPHDRRPHSGRRSGSAVAPAGGGRACRGGKSAVPEQRRESAGRGADGPACCCPAGSGTASPVRFPAVGVAEAQWHEFDPAPLDEAGTAAGTVTRFLAYLAVPVWGTP